MLIPFFQDYVVCTIDTAVPVRYPKTMAALAQDILVKDVTSSSSVVSVSVRRHGSPAIQRHIEHACYPQVVDGGKNGGVKWQDRSVLEVDLAYWS